MKYNYIRIKYTSPATGRVVFSETFGEISTALDWVDKNHGYALRESLFDIRVYFTFISCKITLSELHDEGFVGDFVSDENGGYYKYK